MDIPTVNVTICSIPFHKVVHGFGRSIGSQSCNPRIDIFHINRAVHIRGGGGVLSEQGNISLAGSAITVESRDSESEHESDKSAIAMSYFKCSSRRAVVEILQL